MATAVRYAEGNYVDYTPGSDVTAGAVIDLGNFIGIAERDIAANALGALAIEGIFKVVKKTGEEWSVGDELVYDVGTTSFSSDASYSEAVGGLAIAAAATGDTHGYIKLTPGVVRSA